MNTQHIEELDTTMIYNEIRDLIVSNDLVAGQKILQGKLSETLGVSRTPVVKALHRLSAEGLVDNIPNRGFYVHVMNITELYELLTIRSCFDATVARNLADTCSAEQAEELSAIWKPFEEITSEDFSSNPDIYRNYLKADRVFHRMQYEMCSIKMLTKLNESSQVLNRTLTSGLIRNPFETFKEHKAIVDAIKNRDPELAYKMAYTHNFNTTNNLSAFIVQMKAMGLDPNKVTLNYLQGNSIYLKK